MIRRSLCLAGIASLLLATPALADTWKVTGTEDGGTCNQTTHECPSLRAAIAASEATKEVKDVINVPPGVVSLNDDLAIQSDMEIIGDSARTTILDGNLKYRGFRIAASATDVDIRHLTIRNAQAGQAAIPDGGGIYNQGVLELSYVRITGSRAPEGGGGAIANSRGAVQIDHSLIDGNTARNVGGIVNVGGSVKGDGGSLRIEDSTIFNNAATLAGVGGIGSIEGRRPTCCSSARPSPTTRARRAAWAAACTSPQARRNRPAACSPATWPTASRATAAAR